MLWMETVVELFTLLQVLESQTAKNMCQIATLVDDHRQNVDIKNPATIH